MAYTIIPFFIFILVGIGGIATKNIPPSLIGFGLSIIIVPHLIKMAGLDIFIDETKNTILYSIIYTLGIVLMLGGIFLLI